MSETPLGTSNNVEVEDPSIQQSMQNLYACRFCSAVKALGERCASCGKLPTSLSENEKIKVLLEGQTVVIVTVKKVGQLEIEPMVRIDKVENGMIVTSEGTYTGNRNGSVDYHARSITFSNGIGENVVSRTFQVLNLDGNIGSKYRPYPSNSDELRVLWLDAEEL